MASELLLVSLELCRLDPPAVSLVQKIGKAVCIPYG